MDNLQLYQLALDHLTRARDIQARISKLELENNLLRLNGKYDLTQAVSNNMLVSRNISAIETLVISRNESIIYSIDIALKLLSEELTENAMLFFSSGDMMLDSILSFIEANKIKLLIPLATYLQASSLNSMVMSKGFQYFNIQQHLQKICNI